MVISKSSLWWVLVTSYSFCVNAEEANRHRVDFSGSWELDYQLSDHPREKIRHLYAQARSKAERAAQRAQNSRSYVDPEIFNVESVIGLGRLAEQIAQATVLTIAHENDHIVIQRNNDFALVCDFALTGWKKTVIGAEGCEWDEDQLLFHAELPTGLRVFHKFSISDDRSKINVATKVAGAGTPYPFTLNRVYMPFDPGKGMYDCEYTISNQTSCTLGGNSE